MSRSARLSVNNPQPRQIEAIGARVFEWRYGDGWDALMTIRTNGQDRDVRVRAEAFPVEYWKTMRLRDQARNLRQRVCDALSRGATIFAEVDGVLLPICADDFGVQFKRPRALQMFDRQKAGGKNVYDDPRNTEEELQELAGAFEKIGGINV